MDWRKSRCAPRRRQSARESSTSPTCIRSSAPGPGAAPTASSSPGTPTPGVSSGNTRRRRWNPRRSSRTTRPVGTWNNEVIALNAKTGRHKWRFRADDQVNTSAAYWKGRIFIASDGGTLYALSAKNGRLLWSAQSDSQFGAREFWYATPTVAYGRVYIGNTDGTMYVFGAKAASSCGHSRWGPTTSTARPPSTSARSSWAPTTASSTRWTPQPATRRAGRSMPRGPCTRCPDRVGRTRLLRGLLELRLRGPARGGQRTGCHLRGACA